ncbi:MAG: replication initiator protein A [Candidatus Latescibacteria bacterium]|nr:replication initiator protein A [Candidatus Latescibacterota bacterium]
MHDTETITDSLNLLRVGKDEMNLVELPFTLLSRRNSDNRLVFERRWSTVEPDGTARTFYKQISGDPILGLPTFQSEEVYIAMMEVSNRQGFQSRRVHTTRYELLQIMRWPDTGRYYQKLQEAMDQLLAVTIRTNAFWDHRVKQYVELGFGIIDDYYFLEGEQRGRKRRDGQLCFPLSYFNWNEVIFESFRSGYIKTLNTEVYFGLTCPTSKRLYRYLDKQLYRGESFEIDLFRLTFDRLEMSDRRPYPSVIIANLQQAIREHEEKGLAKITIRKSKTPSGYKAVVKPITTRRTPRSPDLARSLPLLSGHSLQEQLAVRGILPDVAEQLVRKYAERIQAKIEIFDWMLQNNREKIQNPTGFLRRMIEEDWPPPEGFVSQADQEEHTRKAEERRQELQRQEDARRAAEALAEQARQHRREASPWKEVWEQIADSLAQQMPRQSFCTWIQPLFVTDCHDTAVVIDCPSRFLKEYVEEKYRLLIEEAVAAVCGENKQAIFVCPESDEGTGTLLS